ncbi:MAG: hypothetical protein HQM16_04165 [Deltaproteobacteria bacterium]|nr:hypothetical protein [Deltaproteobacteria bacterium]
MFKKTLLSLVVLGLVLAAGTASAQYCNGTIVPDNDCDSGNRAYSTSCCPRGYRAQGVAYNDMAGSDEADAISPICRHVSKGNDMMPTDFQTQPVQHLCDKTEVMSGIACKDMPKKGAQADDLDGCTAICYNPKTKQERMLYSADLEGNRSRQYVTHKIDLPNRIFGIAYKDRDRGSSDVADCATIVYRYEPIVK